MAELALIHILKLLIVIVRLQLASIIMPQESADLIDVAVDETEIFLNQFIETRSQSPITPKVPIKRIIH